MSSEPIRLLGEHTHVSPGDVFRGHTVFLSSSFIRERLYGHCPRPLLRSHCYAN